MSTWPPWALLLLVAAFWAPVIGALLGEFLDRRRKP